MFCSAPLTAKMNTAAPPLRHLKSRVLGRQNAQKSIFNPPPRAPTNGRPGFLFWFSGRWRALANGTALASSLCNSAINNKNRSYFRCSSAAPGWFSPVLLRKTGKKREESHVLVRIFLVLSVLSAFGEKLTQKLTHRQKHRACETYPASGALAKRTRDSGAPSALTIPPPPTSIATDAEPVLAGAWRSCTTRSSGSNRDG